MQCFSKMFIENLGIDNQDSDPYGCDTDLDLSDQPDSAVTLHAFEYDIHVRPQSAQATTASRKPTAPATPKPKAGPRPKSASVQQPGRQLKIPFVKPALPDAALSHDFGRRLAGSRLASTAQAKQASRPLPQVQSVVPISERSMSVIDREDGTALMEKHLVKAEEVFFYQGSAASTLRFLHHGHRHDFAVEAGATAPRLEFEDMECVQVSFGSALKPEPAYMDGALTPLGSAPRYQRSKHNGRTY
jgi:hypothetical protein